MCTLMRILPKAMKWHLFHGHSLMRVVGRGLSDTVHLISLLKLWA